LLDLYDEDIKRLADVYARMNYMCLHTRNSKRALVDLGHRISDEFTKAGFIVNVDMSPCAVIMPNGRSGSPEVEVIGKMDDPYNEKQYDHAKKKSEVQKARDRGEKYLGVKQLPTGE
jgi:hypothetical protein